MNAVLLFIVLAATLTLATLAVLLLPWWCKPKAKSHVDRRQANLEIFRDQLRELERDRDEGLLAPEDFVQARDELQRRLLAETDDRPAPDGSVAVSTLAAERQLSRSTSLSRRLVLLLVVAIPLAAVSIYTRIGNPQAVIPPQIAARQKTQEIEAMLSSLVTHLKTNPDDAKGWLILARTYKAFARFSEAAEAFEKARPLVDNDPALLADYAYVLMQADGGVVGQRAEELIDRALKLDPKQPQALFMAGFAAGERGDFKQAVDHWERLLPQLEPGSEEASAVTEALDKARKAVVHGTTQ